MCLHSPLARADDERADDAFVAGNYQLAFRLWTSEAQAGDSSAMAAIGTLYDTGHGVSQDFANALAWYRRAAEAGNVRAMFNVGAMYDSGRGTPRDPAEAIHWYREAADNGNGRAAYDLGVIYRDGDGAPRDRTLAIRYFREAAAAGIVAARGNLIRLGALPRAPPQAATPPPAPGQPGEAAVDAVSRFQQSALARSPVDPAAAKAFAAVAPALLGEAANGSPLAQYDLAYACENGLGLPVDLVKAYVYYLRATTSEVAAVREAAFKGAAEVVARMTPQQHSAARDMLIEDRP